MSAQRGMGLVRREYSAGAVKHLFWFMEFRKVVQYLYDGKSLEDIKEMNQSENIFGCSTIERSKEIFKTVSARISSLDGSFYPVFIRGDLATQKLFALVSVMAYDTLFFDLVYEVVREQFILGTNELHDRDIRIFFYSKQQQSDRAAKWTEATVKKLTTCYKSMLYEAGMTDKAREKRKIYRPILEREMEQWLIDHGLRIMINALTGVQ